MCLFKRKKPGHFGSGLFRFTGNFLYNSLLLREAADPFAVIDKMEIHGILCMERIVAGNRIGNFTMAFYGFLAKDSAGRLRGMELLITGISLGTTTFLLLKAIAV